MTAHEFRSLRRGDLLRVDGTGPVVVESIYFKFETASPIIAYADIRTQSDEVITGLSEFHATMFHHIQEANDARPTTEAVMEAP